VQLQAQVKRKNKKLSIRAYLVDKLPVAPRRQAVREKVIAPIVRQGLPPGTRLSLSGTADELFPVVYDELRRLAQWHMGNDSGNTLQPTALVHEAYLRLVDRTQGDWRGRTHFIAFASKVMRNLLIDQARRKASAETRASIVESSVLADAIQIVCRSD